ncbi:hypothetical protein E2C01_066215 [Portunus trituberculatus]|uniref:Uncharacterized protein n=1 Tax=Portunus trituberculatus TaxID=210409 RepID=A0A5B7HP61_PORTR|nr:hypothetical protein [Portunus trituberculatus]
MSTITKQRVGNTHQSAAPEGGEVACVYSLQYPQQPNGGDCGVKSVSTPTNYIIGPRGGEQRPATEGDWRRNTERGEACRLLLCNIKLNKVPIR